jgi:hypothetical protein
MKTLIDGCIILDNLNFNIDYTKLFSELNINNDKESNILKELITEAKEIAKPKALFKKCTIVEKYDDSTIIDGEIFFSRVISVNLQKELIAFPYIITSGIELQEWCESKQNIDVKKIADYINQCVLVQVHKELQKYIENEFNINPLARVNPGSTIDWAMIELKKIFNILDNPLKLIGVSLNDKFFMTPSKSYSGIYFHNEEDYKNCLMCPGECPLRETPYNKDYYNFKYKLHSKK